MEENWASFQKNNQVNSNLSDCYHAITAYVDIPCWHSCIRPSCLPSAMLCTSWAARLCSLALKRPRVKVEAVKHYTILNL